MEIKLKRWIIATLGGAFIVIVAMIVIWKLKFYDAINAQLLTTNKAYDTAKTKGETLSTELFAAALANERYELATEQLSYFRQRFRSLPFDVSTDASRNHTWVGYMNEYFADYGLAVRRELVSAANQSGVVISTSLKVDTPPQMPENVAAPPSGFLKPITGGILTVSVTGDFSSILDFLNRINRSAILMTVGAIRLQGASPSIQATFTISPYLVASGPSAIIGASGQGAPVAATSANPDA